MTESRQPYLDEIEPYRCPRCGEFVGTLNNTAHGVALFTDCRSAIIHGALICGWCGERFEYPEVKDE